MSGAPLPASGLHRVSREALLDPAFLDALARLRIVARRVPAGGRPAEQRSRTLGSGIEFRDFRPYAAGDDLKAVDWNIYRRLGRVVLRLYEELEDLPVYVLLDLSSSMHVESPPRAHAAMCATMGLASIALGQHDRIGVYPYAGTLREVWRPKSGRGRLLQLADHLAQVEVGGATDLGAAVSAFAARRLRPGLLVIVSDFFDATGLGGLREALRAVRHRLVMLPLVRASDRAPALRGDVRLRDCETGSTEDVSVDAATLERYQGAYDAFRTELTAIAQARHAGLLELDADADVAEQLGVFFEAGRLVV